jgi:predicted Fe-Mo cluster-binding NifX family protein
MTVEKASDMIRVAVPTANSGGMLASSSAHFGRCPHFTVVEVTDGKPVKTVIVDNPPHSDCFGPVQLLASQDVSVMIVQGIGMRPLAGFRSVGIEVYAGSGGTVGDLITAYTSGKLVLMDESSVCGGGRQQRA